MVHPTHRAEFRQSLVWLMALLASLGWLQVLPTPDIARGLAGYVPLHTAMEMLAIAVAAMVFGISWTTQRYGHNGRAAVLGIAFLGVAVLDMSHTLSFAGMPDFVTPSGAEKGINFWLAARSLAALVLLYIAFAPPSWNAWWGRQSRYLGLGGMVLVLGVVHGVFLFRPDWMPRTFIPGEGLTDFKVRFEYGLIAAYIVAGLGFWRHLRDARVFGASQLALASFTMAMAEYFFTLYANVTDVYNVVGHLYKIASYGFLYRSLFVETVQKPYQDLMASELHQRATLDTLPDLLFEVDPNGVYLRVHATETGKLAAPVHQLIGRALRDVLPPEAAATCHAALAQAEVEGVSRGQRIALPVPDGVRHFELSVAKKVSPDDQHVSYLVLSRDITETVDNERRVEFENHLNAALLDLQQPRHGETDEDFLRRGVEHAQRLTGSTSACVHLVHEDQQHLQHGVWSCELTDEHPEHQSGLLCAYLLPALRERQPLLNNAVAAPPAGTALPFEVQRLASTPVLDAGKARLLLAVCNKPRDYDDQDLQALQVLADAIWNHTKERRQEAVIHRLSEALDQSPYPVVITDAQATIQYVNRAFTEVSGYPSHEVLGRTPALLKSGQTPLATYTDLWTHLNQGQPWQGEFINRRKDGQTYIERASLYPIRDAQGHLTHFVAHKEDITLRRAAEERIRALSDFDTLTGLTNRKAFDEQLAAALAQSAQNHERLSLLWIDLDNFKVINETLGHAAGDELLVEMANRLRACWGSQISLARYSGDTFVALVPKADQATVTLMVRDALADMQRSLLVQGSMISVGASVGIAVFPHDAQTAGALTSAAEVAMYQVKQEGRNGLRFFAPEMQVNSQRSLELAASLKDALERNELFLVFQPQLALGTGQLVGAEALLRWRHPKWGLVCPAEFIPIAEQTGLIVPIGLWVLEQVAQQIHRWDALGLPPLVVAVNVSAVQFDRPQLVDELLDVVQRLEVSPTRIEVELTEAVALRDPELAGATIDRLHDIGFRVSLDDFGTGYSSMSYLKRYAIDKLKIDQSFVRDLASSESDRAIVTAIVRVAHSLKMVSIAEGVETAEQMVWLKTCGCDEVQGYVYSRPLELPDFEAFVRAQVRATLALPTRSPILQE